MAARPKRVRTGCLTCRERHLKCDEGVPDCLNCKKSSRECRRGVRLNFIDTLVKTPPSTPPSTAEWQLSFLDESREIASGYLGGLDRYAAVHITNSTPDNSSEGGLTRKTATSIEPFATIPVKQESSLEPPSPVPTFSSHGHFMLAAKHPLSSANKTQASNDLETRRSASCSGISPSAENGQQVSNEMNSTPLRDQRFGSTASDSTINSSYSFGGITSLSGLSQSISSTARDIRDILTDPQELLFMQVFVEEVGIWMDSMDPRKHFSRLLPFDALQEPMLLNAFLSCGARHLTLVNPAYDEKYAVQYYANASTLLLRQMQNPYRDSVICTTTAVILNVYEIMTERALQRMNHIAGARALIKECGWNATSRGVGAACFWLNIGMELLSCLHFNWQCAWNPDDWGVDMNFDHGGHAGQEEIWTHRIVWIVAKISNFRASMTPRPGDRPLDHAGLLVKAEEWKRWKDWLDGWELKIPRTMRPLGKLHPFRTTSKSLFPEVWLIKRTTIVARMFYHTGDCLLAQTNPLSATNPQTRQEMQELEMRNARELCGIVAHVKDRGVASVALRSLAIAAECLTDRTEQDEVLSIFDKIRKETGWRINFIFDGLKKKWGHVDEALQQEQQLLLLRQQQEQQQRLQQAQQQQQQLQQQSQGALSIYPSANSNVPLRPSLPLPPPAAPPPPPQLVASSQAQLPNASSATSLPSASMPKMPPMGIVNPQFAKADFQQPDHPYQKYYVPPATMLQARLTSTYAPPQY